MTVHDDISEGRRGDVARLFDSAAEAFPDRLAGRALDLAARLAARDDADAPLAPGDVVGPYEVLAPLGAGGQGIVYRARHRHLGREVALKVPRRAIASRLLREAKLAASLEHARIVRVEHVEPEGATPHMVLELCEGGSLAELLAGSPGGLTVARAREIAEAVLEALAYAHGRGVVHCDLKPANVLFDREGEAKLADFGVGRAAAEEGSPLAPSVSMTAASLARGAAGGTPAYMAPEQEDPARLGGERLDGRADLFAFGKLLFQLLTGARPSTVRPIARLRPELDPRWDDVLFKLLEERREDRYASADAVLATIRAILRDPLPAAPAGRLPARREAASLAPEPREPPVWTVRRPWFLSFDREVLAPSGESACLRGDAVLVAGSAPLAIEARGECCRMYVLRDGRGRRLAVALPARRGFRVALRGVESLRLERARGNRREVVARAGPASVLRITRGGVAALHARSEAARLPPSAIAFLYYLFPRCFA